MQGDASWPNASDPDHLRPRLPHDGQQVALTGEIAGFAGSLGFVGGLYYGLNGAPDQECRITTSYFDDCLILADNFIQYSSAATPDPIPASTSHFRRCT